MVTFWDYVRGRTNEVPQGYAKNGLDLYRHLVYIGVDQMLEDCFPEVQKALGPEAWTMVLKDFIASSQWNSNFYGDLEDEFFEYLANSAS